MAWGPFLSHAGSSLHHSCSPLILLSPYLWLLSYCLALFEEREINVRIVHNFLSLLTGSLSASTDSLRMLSYPYHLPTATAATPFPVPGPLVPDLLHDAFLIIISE